jgi:hypothetical protein
VSATDRLLAPWAPVFGLTSVRTGVPAVTVNPLVRLATSVPVVRVTALEPVTAVGAMFTTAVALVAEFTVSDATVIPEPKVATVVPWTKCVDWPVIEIERACCPCFPLDGLKRVIEGDEASVTATDCVLLLPATSKAWTLIVFVPGARVTGQLNAPAFTLADTPLHVTVKTPDKESDTTPVTVSPAVVTTTPFAGEVILSVGGVLSIFRVTLVLTLFPALSVAVPEII